MNWKSFKEQEPLEDQRVLIYIPESLDWVVHFYAGQKELKKSLYDVKCIECCLWIPVPNLPDVFCSVSSR